jgi:hypothetical protein
MSREEGKVKANIPVDVKISLLQAAVKQSVALPTESLAKAQKTNNPAPNVSALQKASQQCTTLPQNRKVIRDAPEKSTEQG